MDDFEFEPRDLLDEARQIPVPALLATLKEPDADLTTIQTIRLSFLDPTEFSTVFSAIQSLSDDRRKDLYVDLEDLSQTNLLVDYEEFFVRALKDSSAQIRQVAARALADSERENVCLALIELLKHDTEVDVQAQAAASLGGWVYMAELEEMEPGLAQETIAALLEVANSKRHALVRRRALESLGYAATPEVNALIQDAIDAEDESWHSSALLAMGRSGVSQWHDPVIENLDHANNEIRTQAARAAGELFLEDSAPALMTLLEDDDQEVRMAAVWALSQVGGEVARTAIESVLDRTEDEAEIEWIQSALANLLFYQDLDDLGLLDLDLGGLEDDEFPTDDDSPAD